MVIERIAFARVMGGFADRIGRALAPETAEMYFDVLSSALTTDEFLAGSRIVFRTHRYNTWPEPQQFIDAAKPEPAPTLSGAEAFERVLALTNDPRIADYNLRIALLGTVVERAYRAAGGYREFANILETDVKWLRKSFVEAYELAAESEARESDAVASLASVTAPRLGEMESGAALVIRGLAQLKSVPAKPPVKDFQLSGRDRAAGETP